MSHLLYRIGPACLAAIACWLAFSPHRSPGQPLFLGTNGDARSSWEDAAESTATDPRVANEPARGDLEQEVAQFIMRYRHGMPRHEARQLGTGSLPTLVRMLGDERYKAGWRNVTATIAFIGDTSYFDTLRAFVWSRFAGSIDENTFRAIRGAQVSLNVMATMSGTVLDYLQATSRPAAWASLPWTAPGRSREDTADLMADETITALGYTDSERARQILLGLLNDWNSWLRDQMIRGALETLDAVRAEGFLRVWQREDNPHPEDWVPQVAPTTKDTAASRTGVIVATGGEFYFGGKLMQPPYAIEYVGDILVVNGYRLRPSTVPQRPRRTGTHQDSLIYALSLRASALIQRAYADGLSDPEVISRLGQFYLTSDLVQSVEYDSLRLTVTYRDRPEWPERVILPQREASPPPTEEDRQARQLERKREELLYLTRTLDSGAAVVILPTTRLTFPKEEATRVRDAINRLRLKGDTSAISGLVPASLWAELRAPVGLVPAKSIEGALQGR